MDYKNGRIYQILNKVNKDVYVGSTCQPLSKRMAKHRMDMLSKTKLHRPLYTKMNQLGSDCFYIELLEEYPCESKEQLRKREGHYIRELGTLNTLQAGRTQKEWTVENKEHVKEHAHEYYLETKDKHAEKCKAYYEGHKPQIQEYHKDYYQTHKEEQSQKQKDRYQEKKEIILERNRKYKEENKDKLKEHYLMNSEKNKARCKAYREKRKALKLAQEKN
jgi:hypothetical protein